MLFEQLDQGKELHILGAYRARSGFRPLPRNAALVSCGIHIIELLLVQIVGAHVVKFYLYVVRYCCPGQQVARRLGRKAKTAGTAV